MLVDADLNFEKGQSIYYHIPTNRPAFPNSSSILSNWLYFAFLSLLAGAPVLISSAPKYPRSSYLRFLNKDGAVKNVGVEEEPIIY